MIRQTIERATAAALLSVVALPAASLAEVVFVDYSSFQTRLNSATSSAGVAAFNQTEIDEIQSIIGTSLLSAYSGFDVTFTTTQPTSGDFSRLHYGASTSGGGFGVADGIDFRNLDRNDLGRVFTANFGSFIESGDPRSQQINEIAISLAGTGAHELGHNLGLQHYDCYGSCDINPANTQGLQNRHIMATGNTGLSETEREIQRSFADVSRAKLEFAQGMIPNGPTPINEGGSNNSLATAQVVPMSTLTTIEMAAAVVIGETTNTGRSDFFSFDALAGSQLFASTFSSILGRLDSFDTILRLFDINGVLITENDDIRYDDDSFGTGNRYGDDSALFNVLLPDDGTYFLEVAGVGSETGEYELFFATTLVPEPTSLFALLPLALLARRRSLVA